MIPADIARRIRRLHLQARRAVRTLLGGEYHSVFKGTGLSFDEVREYQPGDDIRTIDWNVTARMASPFVKRFVEERELTVLLVVDLSGSLAFGTQVDTKRNVAAEVAALVAFSAIANNDRVGLVCFTDEVEKYLRPAKGTQTTLRLLRDILFFRPVRKRTSLRRAFEFVSSVQRRRAIVFFISDFLDTGYEQAFRLAAGKHDLIAVAVADDRERAIPHGGLVDLIDAESGERRVVRSVASAPSEAADPRRITLRKLCRSHQVDLLEVGTDGLHFDAIVQFMERRQTRQRRGGSA